MRKTGAESRLDLLMRASNSALLDAAGISDRRHENRRSTDRRPVPASGPRFADHE